MLNEKLIGTFGSLVAAGAVALSSYAPQARAEGTNSVSTVTNYLPIASSGFANEVASTNGVPISTNMVYKIVSTNAVPLKSYTLERRTDLTDGENLGHYWVDGGVSKGKINGTVSFSVGDFHPKQEFYRIRDVTTTTNEVQNAN